MAENTFDIRAREWDKNRVHFDRSEAIAKRINAVIPDGRKMKALEFGAGTGILSFLLKDKFSEITLMDSSQEMINVCTEKIEEYNTPHIKAIKYDLEHSLYPETFDIIYSQMVLHHVKDYKKILYTFSSMLNDGGYIALADLYPEDGSFHGEGVEVHKGFDPDELSQMLSEMGFKPILEAKVFELKRDNGIVYPVFLLVSVAGMKR
ncbi:MAG TPA: class I SAM-dependent methyltransferase [Bacteroidales bacterium]|nr:class I SAM-dependent methyltransferase [Bacteroidales bacterium]